MQKLEDLVEKVCYFLLTHGRLESCQAIDIVEAEGGFLLLCFLDKNKTLKFMVAENKEWSVEGVYKAFLERLWEEEN